ncbi:hypothetical protein CCP4SC76_6420003 [Gammaproteobacteria bacterium]
MSAKKEAPKKEEPKPEAVELDEARPAGKKKLLIIIAARSEEHTSELQSHLLISRMPSSA